MSWSFGDAFLSGMARQQQMAHESQMQQSEFGQQRTMQSASFTHEDIVQEKSIAAQKALQESGQSFLGGQNLLERTFQGEQQAARITAQQAQPGIEETAQENYLKSSLPLQWGYQQKQMNLANMLALNLYGGERSFDLSNMMVVNPVTQRVSMYDMLNGKYATDQSQGILPSDLNSPITTHQAKQVEDSNNLPPIIPGIGNRPMPVPSTLTLPHTPLNPLSSLMTYNAASGEDYGKPSVTGRFMDQLFFGTGPGTLAGQQQEDARNSLLQSHWNSMSEGEKAMQMYGASQGNPAQNLFPFATIPHYQ